MASSQRGERLIAWCPRDGSAGAFQYPHYQPTSGGAARAPDKIVLGRWEGGEVGKEKRSNSNQQSCKSSPAPYLIERLGSAEVRQQLKQTAQRKNSRGTKNTVQNVCPANYH